MMRKNTIPALLVASLILLPTLETQAQSDSTFTVKGMIDTIPHATYFVKYSQAGMLIQDTIALDAESRFEYTGTVTEPTVLSLAIKNTFNPNFLGDFSVYEFWVEPGKVVSITGKANWLVEGVYGPVARGKIDRNEPSETEVMKSKYDRLSAEALKEHEENTGTPLASPTAHARIRDSVRMDFIHQHPDQYYALVLLNSTIRSGDTDLTDVEAALDRFPERLRKTHTAKDTEQRLLVKKLTQIGRVMLDFEQLDTLSNPVRLSDYRGKYVLVDFWASWCGPCRKEHPHLVEAYEKFNPDGFEILGISLDESRERWLKAIHDDGLRWAQVSDLKGFDNAVAKRFFIHAIPDNFLLDPEGVIIARGLHGTDVIEKLEQLFKE